VGDLIRILPLERGRVSVVELKLPVDSPNAGRPLFELRLPADSAILALVRESHVLIPQPETVMAAGDEIIALTSPESENALQSAITGLHS